MPDIGHLAPATLPFLLQSSPLRRLGTMERLFLFGTSIIVAFWPDCDYILFRVVCEHWGYSQLAPYLEHRGVTHGLLVASTGGALVGWALAAWCSITGRDRFVVIAGYFWIGLSHPIFDLMSRSSRTPLLAPFSMVKYRIVAFELIRGRALNFEKLTHDVLTVSTFVEQAVRCSLVAIAYWGVFALIIWICCRVQEAAARQIKPKV